MWTMRIHWLKSCLYHDRNANGRARNVLPKPKCIKTLTIINLITLTIEPKVSRYDMHSALVVITFCNGLKLHNRKNDL